MARVRFAPFPWPGWEWPQDQLADEFFTGYHPDEDWAEQIVLDSIFGVIKVLNQHARSVH